MVTGWYYCSRANMPDNIPFHESFYLTLLTILI